MHTDRIANVPSDLLRHEMLMTLAPVPEEAILEKRARRVRG